MTDNRLVPFEVHSTSGTLTSGTQVSIDATSLDSVTADDTQDLASELNRLFAVVQSGTGGQPGSRFSGPFVPFTSNVNIGSSNFDLYAGNTALYARSDNARVNFILPTDAEINAAGVDVDDPVEFAILNQAGTGRFDTGFTPTNTVIIDVEGANNIRRNTPTGTLLNFIEAHQNDLVTLTQSARGQPWVAVRVTLSSAALLLPTGLFRLNVGTQARFSPALTFISGFPAGVTPQAGDAYQVNGNDDAFGGYGVETGDVIVALQDNPSRLRSADNDDWLVIRNATNDIISLSEINFLNTVTETDTFEDDRLMDRSDVTNVRVFLSTGILDHAPFISPSTDPDNPQDDDVRYVGGDEDVSSGNEFHLTDFTKVGEPAGSTRFPNALMYFDIDGSFDQTNLLDQVFVVVKNQQGEEVSRHSAADDFRQVVLSGSTDTYYVFDTVGAADNYSSINYLAGYTIDVVFRRTLRSFALTDDVNVVDSIPTESLGITKLDATTQAKINSDQSLTDAQSAALRGLETNGTPTTWTAGDLYVRDTDPSASSESGHYYNVGQQNGILSNHGHSRNVTFVVPNFVSVTGLQRADDTSVKLDVTRIGALTIQDSTQNPPTTFSGQGFTATLPASTFDINNPVGDSWIVEGTASNLELSGAADSFKIDRANLSDDVIQFLHSLEPQQAPAYSLPDNLGQMNRHLATTTATTSTWTSVHPNPIRADLDRQFAALWDENRRTFTGNYFADKTGVEVIGYNGNNIFYYNDPNDDFNTGFPGAQSYILNSNVRIRNQSGQSTITDSFRKVIGFDYALETELTDSTDVAMVRVGSTSTTPLMGLHDDEGLYLNIGRGDGGQRTRTVETPLSVAGGHWHDQVDEVTAAEAEIIIPSNLTGSLEVTVEIQLDNNGNDEGTHVETFTINNVGADQTIGNRTFDYTGFPSVTTAITYEHDNNDLSFSRRVIFLRPTEAFTNAALTYNVRAHYPVTQTWNVATTYARYPINAGNSHDDFGLFDPHRWTTEHVQERNRVLFLFQKWEENDNSADPELAVRVVVDGELENNGNPIRLHRPASDFAFNDINFGNNIVGTSHIQCYDYDGAVPSGAELLRMYNGGADWLGAFYPPGHEVDDFILSANLELTAGHGIILTDADDSVRKLIEIDAGAISISNA